MKSRLKLLELEKAERNQLDEEGLFQNPVYILLVLDLQLYYRPCQSRRLQELPYTHLLNQQKDKQEYLLYQLCRY